MKTPMGCIEVPSGWVQSTVTTVRFPSDDPARAMSVVLRTLSDRSLEPAKVHESEKRALRQTFGAGLRPLGDREVRFLGSKRKCFLYAFEANGEEVVQGLVAGASPAGTFAATVSSLRRSFDAHWPELAAMLESFAGEGGKREGGKKGGGGA